MTGWRWRRSEGPPGADLRRRLLVWSAPIAIVLILALVKLGSVAIAGGAAAADFVARDAAALRGDVTALNIVNVVEPANAYFAAGSLAVLDGRLADADAQFSAALARTEPGRSCPARINLELVRETLGDRAERAFDASSATSWYVGALTVVEGAPVGCFTGSTDSDDQRRALLDGATARLHGKIDAARVARAAPPPPPPQLSPPSATLPPSASTGSTSDRPDGQRRLNPGGADPLERLQQILRDAAAQNER